MKLRGWAGPVAAVLAALMLTGCSSLTPGTASVVDGTRITDAQVDDLVTAQCDAAAEAKKAGQSTAVPISDIKRRSLGLLMDTTLSKKYAEAEGVQAEKALTDAIYGQFSQSIEQLPASPRKVLGDAFHSWAEGRAGLVAAAADAAGQTPSPSNVEQLMNAGVKARNAWQKHIEIVTDPRFSPDKDGLPGPGDGSVSTPSSSFAKSSVASQVDPAWVGDLPASQKCG